MSGRGLRFDNLQTELGGSLLEQVDLLVAVSLVVVLHAFARSMNRLFGLVLRTGTLAAFKSQMAEYYSQTHQRILERIVSGNMVHADETYASVKGKRGYVWVFTNMHDAAYVYCENREGELVKTLLGQYKGVLVSDFYAVYNALDCPQQKCLIHLVRDLNGVIDNPYDKEVQHIVRNFGQILKTSGDVDRYGLRKHFLRKHVVAVDRFYRKVVRAEYHSQAAVACRDRFERNRDKLFSFYNSTAFRGTTTTRNTPSRHSPDSGTLLRVRPRRKAFGNTWFF
jgi:hypothetical protein